MNVKELMTIAAAAYGPDWKQPLATAVGMSREMMWRYEKEVTPINDDIAEKIRRICISQITKRVEHLKKVLARYAA
jgi:predicted transcriptional regulator